MDIKKWIGKVVCDKESYDLFQKTLAELLQTSMLTIFESKVVATGKDHDGRLLIHHETREAKYTKAGDVSDSKNCFIVPFHIFMTGDSSFFSLILGKGSLSTNWYSCNLASAKWKLPSHEKGTAWTLDRLIGMYQQLTEQNRIIEGVKRLPLLTTLEVD